MIPSALRRLVLERANECCEYCLISEFFPEVQEAFSAKSLNISLFKYSCRLII